MYKSGKSLFIFWGKGFFYNKKYQSLGIILSLMTAGFTHVVTCDLFLIYSFKNKSTFLLQRKYYYKGFLFQKQNMFTPMTFLSENHQSFKMMKILFSLKVYKVQETL